MSRGRLTNANPSLEVGFRNVSRDVDGPAMTLEGTVVKTALLLSLLTVAAAFGWQAGVAGLGLVLPLILVSFVLALVVTFKPRLAKPIAIPYSLIKGFAVGGISRWYNDAYGDGIVVTALGLTLGITAALLAAYTSGLIKPSENFKLGVAAACGGIALFYLATIVAGMFGFTMPLVNSNSTFGIVFTAVVVCIAAASLVCDFDFIEEGVKRGAPGYMEWYGAFGLMVTIVWLYLEILRLCGKLMSRN